MKKTWKLIEQPIIQQTGICIAKTSTKQIHIILAISECQNRKHLLDFVVAH